MKLKNHMDYGGGGVRWFNRALILVRKPDTITEGQDQKLFKLIVSSYPASISTSDQRCFNVVDQRWNNVDTTLKMKQNPTSDFQRCTTLIQRESPTMKKRRAALHNVQTTLPNVGTTLVQRFFNPASTLVKAILNPIGLVMVMVLQIDE